MPNKDIEKLREYQRKWKANRRTSYFKNKICAFCGSNESLELDHIDRELKESHDAHKCRCELCKKASSDYRYKLRHNLETPSYS